jgi:hypothetical protein
MLWFMAHSANAVSRERGLGLHFQVLVPCQLMPGTTLGQPTIEELRQDPACCVKEMPFGLGHWQAGIESRWERGEHDGFYPYGKTSGQVFREQA